jgi:hypothetical protein
MMTGSNLLKNTKSQNNLNSGNILIRNLPKILLLLLLINSHTLLSQINGPIEGLDDIELNQDQWEAVRDHFVVEAIKMLAKMDTLSGEIDSLKQVLVMIDNYDCEEELYAMVGATREEVRSFRLKFEETEKRISGKIGTPDDARTMYYDEVSASKIKCLPEFYERFRKMENMMIAGWESGDIKTREDIYTVVKGDCLWKISGMKYKTPYLWPAIWDANRNTILNPEQFEEDIYRKVYDPNYIYPGQVLKIPSVNDQDRKDAEQKSKEFRKTRSR